MMGKDLAHYSSKIELVDLCKCSPPLTNTNKAYLSDIAVTNISWSFAYKMAAKTS